MVVWYLIVDEPPIPSYGATWQSGLYLRDGTPQPALVSFRFPSSSRAAAQARWRGAARPPPAPRASSNAAPSRGSCSPPRG